MFPAALAALKKATEPDQTENPGLASKRGRLTDDRLLGLTGGVGNHPRDDNGVTTEQEGHEVVTAQSDLLLEVAASALHVDHGASHNDLCRHEPPREELDDSTESHSPRPSRRKEQPT